ncbi:hypothetical protein I4U23_023621 [Adineta vaga]|nr:hypothetical protein I4U23_023621 [Adineta vaga]
MVDVYTIQAGTVFAWFMFFMVARRLVILIIAAAYSRNRPFVPGSRPPEDKILKSKTVEPASGHSVQAEFTKDVRANKVISNDGENDPYFFILLLATAAFSDDVAGTSCTRTIVYGVIYLFARVVFAISYVFGLQPWRTLAFSVGFLCTLACSLDLIITMSMRSN